MRPAALGSPGRASLEDEGPVTVKLEDSEEDEPAAWDLGPEAARQQFRSGLEQLPRSRRTDRLPCPPRHG